MTVAGGDVRISGGDRLVAGRGVDLSAGQPGGITVAARGAIVVSGPVNASGDASTGGYGSDGAAISHGGRGISRRRLDQLGGRREHERSAPGAGGSVALSAGARLSAGAINTPGAGSPHGRQARRRRQRQRRLRRPGLGHVRRRRRDVRPGRTAAARPAAR